MSTTKLKSVDVVVVGSGVVGSIMSMELASAGLCVVCLERGKQFDANTDFHKPNVYDELKFDRHSDIFRTWPATPLPFATTTRRRRCRCARWGRSSRARWSVARRRTGA